MKSDCIYCSARDQNVHVVLQDEPAFDGHANIPDLGLVCLEIGEQCTGGMCPLGAEPASVMAARLVRSGLPTSLPTVKAVCDGCDRTTDLAVLPKNLVICTECGTVTRWTVLRADESALPVA